MAVQDAPAWLTRLTAWLEAFESAFSHRAQRGGLRRYVEGVLSDSRRKSMEAMWARLRDPGSYQALQYFITEADWSADAVWRRLRAAIPAREGILVLDGTGFPKQGRASVGVSRQYSGTLGKIGNCQVAVTAALWTGAQAWLVGARLYLPATWLTAAQRARGRIPATVVFQEKWRLALTLLRQVRASGITVTAVVADAESGDCTAVRRMLHAIEIPYALGVSSHLTVFAGTPRTEAPAPPHRSRSPAGAAALGAGRHADQHPRSGGADRRSPLAHPSCGPRNLAALSTRSRHHARDQSLLRAPARYRLAQSVGPTGASSLGDRATVRRTERRTGARPFRRTIVPRVASTRRADRDRLRVHSTRTPTATTRRPDVPAGAGRDHRYSDGALFLDASTSLEHVVKTGGNTAADLTKSY